MPNDKPFLRLKNRPESEPRFNKFRPFKRSDPDETPVPKIPKEFHQTTLRSSFRLLNVDLRARVNSRTLDVPAHIDLVKVHFLTRFKRDLEKKFYKRYGLRVIQYEDFNQTVLFSIDDENDFRTFKKHLQDFFESRPDKPYDGKPYSLVALIQDFRFLSTSHRYQSFNAELSSFSIIPLIDQRAKTIYDSFLQYLREKGKQFEEDKYLSCIEVSSLSRTELREVLNNFDIVKSVHSSRSARIKPGVYGDVVREYGFEVLKDETNITVGVIDTGVMQIDPLKPVLSSIAYDITGNDAPFWDENGHGTMVAGLVALGTDFLTNNRDQYASKANVAVIKVLQNANGEFSVNRMVNVISQVAQKHGIRIFNLSMNDPIPKKYNSPVSDYAYALDKLAHDLEILIFISTGNILADKIKELQAEDHTSHVYPVHFYSPSNESDFHSCQSTNICPPAESMNNVSVGALADNFGQNYGEGITPAKELPAFYTRKFHIDYKQRLNGTDFNKFQKNKFLVKPDLIFNGGDLFEQNAGIEVLTSPVAQHDKYFSRSAGTSLSTPLVTSMAAEILKVYPSLHVQTVKAILLNSAESPCGSNPLPFRNTSLPGLLRKLVGYGMPIEQNLTFTNENGVTFIVEDEIDLEEVKSIDIRIPKRILKNKNKLCVTATLCFTFDPIRENHLNYCPLQIVFGFFKPSTAQQLANDKVEKYKIKPALSWSEDTWAPEGRLYSNVQQLFFHLTPEHLESIGYTTTLAIKCTGKKEIIAKHRDLLELGGHRFSLIFNITEVPENNASGELYNQLIAINTIEDILSTNIDLDINAG